jgi:hypothetical protein
MIPIVYLAVILTVLASIFSGNQEFNGAPDQVLLRARTVLVASGWRASEGRGGTLPSILVSAFVVETLNQNVRSVFDGFKSYANVIHLPV